MANDQIFEIVQFEKLTNFQNLTIWKIRKKMYHLENQYSTIWKLLNILSVQIISQKWKNQFENKTID